MTFSIIHSTRTPDCIRPIRQETAGGNPHKLLYVPPDSSRLWEHVMTHPNPGFPASPYFHIIYAYTQTYFGIVKMMNSMR